ncbi:putative fatty acyl-CoA reductase CG5065 isoform X2 [Bacillus rossius redtenbacheri]|uniref:putative fatty acyl-CoA reductase CG5065 isoform X2 n=1 Tax=Bacillus rossius redtenbacheri TaxID=93214 RepID=UPI002FDCE5C8
MWNSHSNQAMSDTQAPGLIRAVGPVQQFYCGRSVLLTGATGFCGKVLLEKLLRSCPGLERVYLVVRPRRGRDEGDRVANLLNQPLFGQLGRGELGKVVAVCGDLSRPGLGLSLEDKEMLCRQVSIIFHVGASVRFDDELCSALATNVWATEAIVKLAKSMDHLKALVCVSTAYSNCISEEVEEQVCKPLADPEDLYKRLATMSEDELASFQTMILSKWPNTYTFTKALAETVVKDTCETLPVAIFRPSIVTPVWREPVVGWLDSMNGPTLSLMGGALGKMRCGMVKLNNNTDMVPVDMVASGIIATAWDVSSSGDRKSPKVYNFVSGARNPITWRQFYGFAKKYNRVYPSADAMWYCISIFTQFKWLYILLSLLLELLPAVLMDVLPYLSTGKHKNIDLYMRARRFLHLVTFFSMHQWRFHDGNVVDLLARMSPEDKAAFPMDVTDINWREYVRCYVLGVREHMLKEPLSNLPAARKRYFRLFLLHHALRVVLWTSLATCLACFAWKCV